jgi:serine protease Do
MTGGVTAVAAVVCASVFAPMVNGQDAARPRTTLERRIQVLEGRGSTIGVSIRDLTTDEAARAKLPQAGGVSVQEVEEGSPAAKAGLRVDDVIVEFDGERVRSARHLTRLVQETPDGRTVKATIVRDGSRQTVDIAPDASARPLAADIVLPDIQREIERGLRAIPRNFSFDFDPDAGFAGMMVFPQGRLGITATTLTDQLAAYFKVKQGVLVSRVAPDSPSAKAGLRAGDVITSVNGRAVDSLRDLTEELRTVKPGAEVEIGITRDGKASTLKPVRPQESGPRNQGRVRLQPA